MNSFENLSEKRHALYTAYEVAEHLSVDAKTIHNWADAGKIPVAVRTGKIIRFDIEEVNRSLAEQTAAAQLEKLKRVESRRSSKHAVRSTACSGSSKPLNNGTGEG